MTRPADIEHSFAVYNGRLHLGEVRHLRAGQFEAVDAEENRVGMFDSRRAAELALLYLPRAGEG